MGLPESQQKDEAAILARVDRDPQAFRELYEAFFPRVYNYFRCRVADGDLADDLTAMTFEQAWMGMRKFQPDSNSFSGWLFTIARDMMDEHLRLPKRPSENSLETMPRLHGEKPVVLQDVSQTEILEAVADLEDQPRDLIALKFAARMTSRQIAVLSGLNERDVNINLFQSLSHLRAKLENEAQPDEDLIGESDRSEPIAFDIRALLNDTGLPEGEESPQEVYQTLEVARRLARADFSPQSQIRQSLGDRLAAHPPMRRWSWHKPGGVARLLSLPQAIALAVVIILIVIALVVAIYGLP